jgi:hypothetical protein
VSATSTTQVVHSVPRLTIDVGTSLEDFRSRYERAVPPMPWEQIEPWSIARRPGTTWSPWPEPTRRTAS